MMCNLLLSWIFLLVVSVPLLAHPITDSAELLYLAPLSVGDGGAHGGDDQTYLPQDGLTYTSLLSGDLNQEGPRTAGLLSKQMRDVLLERPSHVNPLSRYPGFRRQFGKRGGNSECFWKYCV